MSTLSVDGTKSGLKVAHTLLLSVEFAAIRRPALVVLSDIITNAGPWGTSRKMPQFAAEFERANARTAVVDAYEGFLVVLNPKLLDLCTAWHIESW